MKRYQMYVDDLDGFSVPEEEEYGPWVRYEDIKDDRALLEKAEKLIVDIADELNSEGGYGHLELETWDELDAYAARVKESMR